MTGVASERPPNTLLAGVMAEAKISNKGLATRVRAEAARIGHDAKPDHVAVSRWLSGGRPHDDTIRCIAVVLGAKLGRKVAFAEIGFDLVPESRDEEVDVLAEAATYPASSAHAVELLAKITEGDLADSPALASSGWTSNAGPGIITGYLFGDPSGSGFAEPLFESSSDVAERIRGTIKYFMDLDFQFGGGHTRKMLLFYWKTEIIPELQRNYPERVRREIFAAAAEAAQIIGWSAYDAGRHGFAQWYFTQGLELARAAGDSVMGARLLSNLSHQANYLGEFGEAAQFARAAQSAIAGNSTGTVNVMLLAMEARAQASLGDERGAAGTLHRAEQLFDRRDVSVDPEWIAYFDHLEFAGEAAHVFRDLGKPVETQRFVELAVDPRDTPPRTRAFIGMVQAAGALASGDVNEAVAIATDAVNLAGGLKSSRYRRYVSDFQASLVDRHAAHPAVLAFGELVTATQPRLWVPESARTASNRATSRREASSSSPDIRRQSPETQQRSA